MRQLTPNEVEITHFHMFCGSGGGGIGFQRGHARLGALRARLRCLGGVDVDPLAAADFTRLVGAEATVLDLADEAQYAAIHGAAPPEGWRPARPCQVRAAARGEFPDIVFLSPPCKGFSGLLNPKTASSPRYQALNALTVRGIRLMLAAFADDPPALVILENVPRIAQRGQALLAEIRRVLQHAGYAVAETTHDCGELGGLAQHRKRFLLVARHLEKVPPFLYEPPRQRVRGVGEVLGELPWPDDARGGPMHRCPRLQWQTWVRLALIPAGGDWRSLLQLDHTKLRVERVRAGIGHALSDPRPGSAWTGNGRYRVTGFAEPAGAVIAASTTGNGASALSDPRPGATREGRTRFNDVYRIVHWDDPSPAVTAGVGPSSGGISVADPRPPEGLGNYGAYGVLDWVDAAGAVTSQAEPGSGRFSVADPRVGSKSPDGSFLSAGHFGVVPWSDPSRAVTGSACQDNGAWSVADPRPLPADFDRPDPVPLILALDGTWHRPFTTLELAALQNYPVEDLMERPLSGSTESGWREHIGNSVPPASATAIANTMAHTLLLAFTGERFRLEAAPIWVRPLATTVSVAHVQPL